MIRAKPFTALINQLRYNRSSNGHSILGIQGLPGVGKSTLGITIATNIRKDFALTDIFYEREGCWETIAPAPKGGVFMLDEGTNVAINRTWQDHDQIEMAQLLNTIRQRNHTLIWCQPNTQRLDVVIREDLLTHKINCIERGKARVMVPKIDRDGERKGWKRWPGYAGWNGLDDHPVWGKPYRDAKEATYFQRLRRRKARVRASDEVDATLLELEQRTSRRRPTGDVLV